MGSPCHVSGSTSRQFFGPEASAEFQALSVIAESLAHPQRTLLSVFVQQAVDRELAARFFLNEVSGQDKSTVLEFLANWINLIRKVRPVVCNDLDESLKRIIWRRDGGQCCISKAGDGKKTDKILLFASIFSPSLFYNDIVEDVKYLVRANQFIPSIPVETFRSITLKNNAVGLASLPNAQFLEVQDRFADASAWLEVVDYMKRAYDLSNNFQTRNMGSSAKEVPAEKSSWTRWCRQTTPQMFRRLWFQMPTSFRAFVYKRLASVSHRLYGYTGSDRIYRLPFNLYLRTASGDWASRHQAEFQSLRLVEIYTRIPAPKGIEALRYRDSSFLLMTGLPGKGIGRMISIMTDEQVHAAAKDLKEYIAELRQIPNKTGTGFLICNALGGGILDWRIGDSQREVLRFQNETEFNRLLTYDLPLDEDARKLVFKSHDVKHEVFFTHADLNLRNILVDENGRISGIVDWECAGWYPEYWEYTKMHFGVRVTTRWIVDVIDRIFLGYRDELKAEDLFAYLRPSW